METQTSPNAWLAQTEGSNLNLGLSDSCKLLKHLLVLWCCLQFVSPDITLLPEGGTLFQTSDTTKQEIQWQVFDRILLPLQSKFNWTFNFQESVDSKDAATANTFNPEEQGAVFRLFGFKLESDKEAKTGGF